MSDGIGEMKLSVHDIEGCQTGEIEMLHRTARAGIMTQASQDMIRLRI